MPSRTRLCMLKYARTGDDPLSREHRKNPLTSWSIPNSCRRRDPVPDELQRLCRCGFGEDWVRKRGDRKERPVVPFTLNYLCRRVPFDIHA